MSAEPHDEGSLRIEVIGLPGIPDIRPGDDLGELIVKAADSSGIGIRDGDVLVVAQKIVSKSEGRIVKISDVKPSKFAENLARELNKPAEEVEIILRESRTVIRARRSKGLLITETLHGFVAANSGVDKSNVQEGYVTLLPSDPDESASRIRNRIKELTGKDVAVIISDTFGRPFRQGQVNVAIGVSGIALFRDYRGKRDQYGRPLKVTMIAHVDELASAAELVMGKARRVPVAIIRGYKFQAAEEKASGIPIPEELDVFR